MWYTATTVYMSGARCGTLSQHHENRATFDTASSRKPTRKKNKMSKPVKLILACLICLGVIIGAVLLYQQVV